MKLRVKILALSTALLAILCIALFVSLRLQREVHEEIASGKDYHLPLAARLAEAESAALGYQLALAKAVGDGAGRDVDGVEKQAREIMGRLLSEIDGAQALLAQAVADSRNDVTDRVALARIDGTMRVIRREAAALEASGRHVLAALRRGDEAAAVAQFREFARSERAIDAEIESARRDVEKVSEEAIEEVVGHENEALRISMLLFAAAAIVGLGLAGVIASRLVGGLRRLVDGATEFETGGTMPPIPVTTQDEVGQLTRVFNRMVSEIAAKDRIRDTFGRFVDPKVVANLIDTSGGEVQQAERRVATVFFSDLAGFSGISEQLTAAAVANLLNRWFELSTEAIRAHSGVLDKFIGDAVMAFWTPPFVAGDDHATQACLAALAQRKSMLALRGELPQILGLRRQLPRIDVRMGLATGELVVGTIGGPTAKSYTVIGDVVNLASRLEGVNKVYGTSIIAAEETWRLARSAVEGRELDVVVVGGKTEPVRIFEVVAPVGELAPADAALHERWAEALDRYRARDWGAAEAALAGCLEVAPDDGPARLFRERVARFAAAPPAPDWDGVWRLEKV
jgi:adenylate cyclase